MIHSMWYHSILKNEVNLPPRNFCTSQPLIKYLVGKTIFIYNILYQYILPIQTLFMYRILHAYILYYICILFTHAHLSTIPCPFDSASLQVAGWLSFNQCFTLPPPAETDRRCGTRWNDLSKAGLLVLRSWNRR